MSKYIPFIVLLLLVVTTSCKKEEEKYAQFYSNSLNSFSLNQNPNSTNNHTFFNVPIPDLLANSSIADSTITTQDIEYKGIYLNKLVIVSKINDTLVNLDNVEFIEVLLLKPSISNGGLVSYETTKIAKLSNIALGDTWAACEVTALNLYNIISTSRSVSYRINIAFRENLTHQQEFFLHAQFVIDALLL